MELQIPTTVRFRWLGEFEKAGCLDLGLRNTVPVTINWASLPDKLCYAGEISLRFDRGLMCTMAAVYCGLTPIKRILPRRVSYCSLVGFCI